MAVRAGPRAPRSPRRRVSPPQGGSAGGATCTAALISRSNLTISWWHTRTGTEPVAAAAAAILGMERQGLERPLLAPHSAPQPSLRGGVLQSSSPSVLQCGKGPMAPQAPQHTNIRHDLRQCFLHNFYFKLQRMLRTLMKFASE